MTIDIKDQSLLNKWFKKIVKANEFEGLCDFIFYHHGCYYYTRFNGTKWIEPIKVKRV